MTLLAAANPVPEKPAADGPQATVGPHWAFQVNDEVKTGPIWAVARVVKRRTVKEEVEEIIFLNGEAMKNGELYRKC